MMLSNLIYSICIRKEEGKFKHCLQDAPYILNRLSSLEDLKSGPKDSIPSIYE